MRVIDHRSMAADDVRAWTAALCDALAVPYAAALEPVVERAYEVARAAHPGLAIAASELFAYIGARLDGDPAVELARRHVADLYLACGCERGDGAAVSILERTTLPDVERGLAKVTLAPDLRRDVMQNLREQMLVERDGRRGIAAYDGRAPLAVWLRVCAVRQGIRQAGRARREIDLDDAKLDQIAPGVQDPQLAYLRRHYGAEFQAAFAATVKSLTPRERNLLRHSVIDGFGINQIAAIYHVHRETAARQLKQARAALVEGTRERMRLALRVSESELESIMRMIVSVADVTLRQVLAHGRGHAQETE